MYVHYKKNITQKLKHEQFTQTNSMLYDQLRRAINLHITSITCFPSNTDQPVFECSPPAAISV